MEDLRSWYFTLLSHFRVLVPGFRARKDQHGVTIACRYCALLLHYPTDEEPARVYRDAYQHMRRNHPKRHLNPTR